MEKNSECSHAPWEKSFSPPSRNPRNAHASPPHRYSSSPEVAAVSITGRLAVASESRTAELAAFSHAARPSSLAGSKASIPENGSHITIALLEPNLLTTYFTRSLYTRAAS